MDALASCLVAKSDLVWREERRATPPNYGEHNRVISFSLQSLCGAMRVVLKPTSLDWFNLVVAMDLTEPRRVSLNLKAQV